MDIFLFFYLFCFIFVLSRLVLRRSVLLKKNYIKHNLNIFGLLYSPISYFVAKAWYNLNTISYSSFTFFTKITKNIIPRLGNVA
jgi:hypothetical protein